MSLIIQPFILALQFLTRLPLPCKTSTDPPVVQRALMLFPLAGYVIGALLYGAGAAISLIPSFTPFIAAVLIIALETALTGALHLDGLADAFDAFLSQGKTREEKLAIMKDSRIGVMGCVALILALMLKTTLLARLIELHRFAPLLAFPVGGRWSQVMAYTFSPYVRKGGTGELFASAAHPFVCAKATLLLAPLLFIPGMLSGMLLLILVYVLYRRYVHRHVGGITGDVLGSITVLSEIALLAGILLAQP